MPENSNKPGEQQDNQERIAKVIARRSHYSRRQAEDLIAQGRVKLIGEMVQTPAVKVLPAAEISIDDQPLALATEVELWAFHKPRGCITSRQDERGRKTIYDILPKNMHHLTYVGRLDYNSEGLLLLTNDGEFARKLEHPSSGHARVYRCRFFGQMSAEVRKAMATGVSIDGIHYQPFKLSGLKLQGKNSWITVEISEGKNREIRRVFEHFGLRVNRLIRTQYSGIKLGNLAEGEVRQEEVEL
jgi:23S rRNA pseudouridine2605 synthase